MFQDSKLSIKSTLNGPKLLELEGQREHTVISMYTKQSKILVVADDPGELTALKAHLSHEGFEVSTVCYQGESLQVVDPSYKPDVVLLDLIHHPLHEFLLCEDIRATNPRVVRILLSKRDAEQEILRGFDSGADDFVTKPYSLEVLVARMRAHIRSRRAAAGEQQIIEIGDLCIDVPNYIARVKGKWVDMRPQEFRLLTTMAQSLGKPLSRPELVGRLWEQGQGSLSSAVNTHICRLRAAIEAPSDYIYIHTVKGCGYRFEPVLKEASPSSNYSGLHCY